MYRGHIMFKGFLLLATMAFSWSSVAAVSATAADEYHHLSSAYGRDGVTPAFIVPLFPQKEQNLKKGLPPGMTAYSFWAASGSVAITMISADKVRLEFSLRGLIPC